MENALPAIPPKRYFTIGEVSELCGVKPHVLRYWEQEFVQLRPVKRRGNRRYYQRHEVLLVRRIRDLLYEQGFTISGARNRLTELGPAVWREEDEASDRDDEDRAVAHVIGFGAADRAGPGAALPALVGAGGAEVPTPPVARAVLVRSGARSLRDELLAIRALLDGVPDGIA
ncbi:MAG: hypothetical protein RL456_1215 [Pseudomonadota bacterium]|jgi:DNA-binding transcriptional MerR regulator